MWVMGDAKPGAQQNPVWDVADWTSPWSGKEAGVWRGSERCEVLYGVGQGPVEPSRFRCLSVRPPAVQWHLTLALNLIEDSWILSPCVMGYPIFGRIIFIYLGKILRKDSFLPPSLFFLFSHLCFILPSLPFFLSSFHLKYIEIF